MHLLSASSPPGAPLLPSADGSALSPPRAVSLSPPRNISPTRSVSSKGTTSASPSRASKRSLLKPAAHWFSKFLEIPTQKIAKALDRFKTYLLYETDGGDSTTTCAGVGSSEHQSSFLAQTVMAKMRQFGQQTGGSSSCTTSDSRTSTTRTPVGADVHERGGAVDDTPTFMDVSLRVMIML